MNEIGRHNAHAHDGKEDKVEKEQLKKRIQKHYDMSAEQFLKVWYGAPIRAQVLRYIN